MDISEIGFGAFITVIIIGMIFFGLCCVDWVTAEQVAMGKAHIICQEKGYDFAESVARPMFSTEAIGVKCGIIDYSQKQVKINDTDTVPIVVV